MAILTMPSVKLLKIVSPFVERTRFEKTLPENFWRHFWPQDRVRFPYHSLSYGAGPASYDMRVDIEPIADEVFSSEFGLKVKRIEPWGRLKTSTIEKFDMPDNVAGRVHDKSTWARTWLLCQNTFIDPGWKGYLTLELTNDSDQEIFLIHGMPIVQVVFEWMEGSSDHPYDGKYQNQERGPQEVR